MKTKQIPKYLVISIGIMIHFMMTFATAQVNTNKTLKRIETPIFQQQFLAEYIYLPMDFNDADAKKHLRNIPVSRIESISLIYTQYKMSERFDQMALNDARTAALFSQIPELKSNPQIQWYWIAQTGCQDPESCKSYFHGFEIRLKSESEMFEEKTSNALLDYYTSLYLGKDSGSMMLDSLASLPGSKLIKNCDTQYYELHFSKNRYGNIVPVNSRCKKELIKVLNKEIKNNPASITFVMDGKKHLISGEGFSDNSLNRLEKSIRKYCYVKTSRYKGEYVNSSFTMHLDYDKRKRIANYQLMSVPADENSQPLDMSDAPVEYRQKITCGYYDTSKTFSYNLINEDVVTKVLDRNPQWKNCLVATDVTGSMSPYLGQFLAWHQLHLRTNSKNKDFVFFNDGNNLPDYLKRVGKVGGIYYTQTENYEELKKVLSHAQSKGSGGDGPENNMEAIIEGISNNPGVKEVILIADNWATPRDLVLLDKINKPIHIILCGASSGVNAEYLNLAKKNGGTVHTMEQDLENLSKLTEGEIFSIEGKEFTVKNGKIIRTRSDGTFKGI